MAAGKTSQVLTLLHSGCVTVSFTSLWVICELKVWARSFSGCTLKPEHFFQELPRGLWGKLSKQSSRFLTSTSEHWCLFGFTYDFFL